MCCCSCAYVCSLLCSTYTCSTISLQCDGVVGAGLGGRWVALEHGGGGAERTGAPRAAEGHTGARYGLPLGIPGNKCSPGAGAQKVHERHVTNVTLLSSGPRSNMGGNRRNASGPPQQDRGLRKRKRAGQAQGGAQAPRSPSRLGTRQPGPRRAVQHRQRATGESGDRCGAGEGTPVATRDASGRCELRAFKADKRTDIASPVDTAHQLRKAGPIDSIAPQVSAATGAQHLPGRCAQLHPLCHLRVGQTQLWPLDQGGWGWGQLPDPIHHDP